MKLIDKKLVLFIFNQLLIVTIGFSVLIYSKQHQIDVIKKKLTSDVIFLDELFFLHMKDFEIKNDQTIDSYFEETTRFLNESKYQEHVLATKIIEKKISPETLVTTKARKFYSFDLDETKEMMQLLVGLSLFIGLLVVCGPLAGKGTLKHRLRVFFKYSFIFLKIFIVMLSTKMNIDSGEIEFLKPSLYLFNGFAKEIPPELRVGKCEEPVYQIQGLLKFDNSKETHNKTPLCINN